ncbi:hypothetical protein O6H91_06G068600 [Diphasiastrum complanatum]|uniref:Uncharacterized protein n=2 Tax=Diphasiastrum complanatum TaxID=34168 RepID=A0ACC2DF08_DIPCM|nr:hypothetical protein O6H91_06G068600 [Diphasiastrum complanatum]
MECGKDGRGAENEEAEWATQRSDSGCSDQCVNCITGCCSTTHKELAIDLEDRSPHVKLSQVAAESKSPIRSKTYELEVKNLHYTVGQQLKCFSGKLAFSREESDTKIKCPSLQILHDVSCHAKPGEILAIAGPSGAGKSTLLEILAGRIRPSSGSSSILVNRQPMRVAHFRRISGYVMQHDALFPLLTVFETLMFSAHLRLASSTPESEKASRVEMLMTELGLQHVAGSRIGSDTIRGISGGERRRVSIGVDVIHDPAVLLIDEPTSGLDSAAALQVMSMLRSMAESHDRTIVLSIHQPGYRILQLVHAILLLSRGSVAHHGSLELLGSRLAAAGHQIPPQINVLEYAIETISDTERSRVLLSKTGIFSSINQTLHCQPLSTSESIGSEKDDQAVYDQLTFANSRAREILILCQRFGKVVIRTRQLFAARSMQAILAGIGLGSIFFSLRYDERGVQERLGFFAFTLTFLLSSTTEALPLFLEEREIVMRETSRGAYRISSYVIANTLVFLPFLLFCSLLYSAPVYWLVGLSCALSSYLFFVLVVWLIVVMANSFVAFISALAPNFIMGYSLISGVIGAFFLFSGYFISKESIPKYWIFMHYLSLYKYPLDALLINEYSHLEIKCFGPMLMGECTFTGKEVLVQSGIDKESKWVNLVIMVVFAIAYRFLCYLILRLRPKQTKQ